MPLEYRFTCPLRNGIHARPAAVLESAVRDLDALVAIVNERTGQQADARSVLGTVGLDIRFQDPCRIVVSGTGEASALESLRRFLQGDFVLADAPLPSPVPPSPEEVRLPPVLGLAAPRFWAGTAVVPGVARGTAVFLQGADLSDMVPEGGAFDAGAELDRFRAALEFVAWPEEGPDAAPGRAVSSGGAGGIRIGMTASAEQRGIVAAQWAIARDPGFRARIESAIIDGRLTAAAAIAEAEKHYSAMLLAARSQLVQERALDVQDVCRELLRHVVENDGRVLPRGPSLAADAICIAETMTPGQLLALDRGRLRGLVLARGGPTSHTVVLARSFAIPTLVRMKGLDPASLEGEEVVVDAETGILVVSGSERIRRYYEMETSRVEAKRARCRKVASEPAITSDGRRIEVAANIGSVEEAGPAFEAGAEAIGVFRTEMLFTGRSEPPGEDGQVEVYRAVFAAAGSRPVTIRTLDAGGDKDVPYLKLEREENPFLGCRGVRLYPEIEEVFRTQIRALLRASAGGRLKIMVPMVASVEEARWARAVFEGEKARLMERGVAFDSSLQFGAMLEVPSAVFLIDELSSFFDFFSTGTNDLLQYVMAADRGNPRVKSLYNPLNPAFIRVLGKVAGEARANGKWVGLCGEMGGDPVMLPVLVGLGFDELSVSPPAVGAVKEALRQLSASQCRKLAFGLLTTATSAEARARLETFEARPALPLIDPDLIVLDCECDTREEAVKLLVDRLDIAGRTRRPREVEETVIEREEASSTAFGHGFAVPHCRTGALLADSLAVARLAAPVQWGAGGEMVDTVILLAIRESSEAAVAHLRTLAALARRLTHASFREAIRRAPDEPSLAATLAARAPGD